MKTKQVKFNLPSDWRDLIDLLNRRGVKYLVVGGVAANMYGQPRFTQDIDFFIDRSIDNAKLLKQVLEEFGFSTLQISIEDLSRPHYVVMLGRPPMRVDLITDITPLDFQSAWKRRKAVVLDGLELPIVALDDLIAAKRSAGRPKDIADLYMLEKIQKTAKKKRSLDEVFTDFRKDLQINEKALLESEEEE